MEPPQPPQPPRGHGEAGLPTEPGSAASLPMLRARGGGTYHPEASAQIDLIVEQFQVRLEAAATNICKQDGVKTVDSIHVHRAYQSLVPPSHTKQLTALLGNTFLGASISTLVMFFVFLVQAEGPPAPWMIWGLGLSIVGALMSLVLTIRSFQP
jgi:hypothetical protein